MLLYPVFLFEIMTAARSIQNHNKYQSLASVCRQLSVARGRKPVFASNYEKEQKEQKEHKEIIKKSFLIANRINL